MGQPICHFEIIGKDPSSLRRYYADLFGWEYSVGDAIADEVFEPGQYGFVSDEHAGINGGVAGALTMEPQVLVYVAVPDVEEALSHAERLGGKRRLGPVGKPGMLVVGHFEDPEGNLMGVAGER